MCNLLVVVTYLYRVFRREGEEDPESYVSEIVSPAVVSRTGALRSTDFNPSNFHTTDFSFNSRTESLGNTSKSQNLTEKSDLPVSLAPDSEEASHHDRDSKRGPLEHGTDT